MLVTVDLETTGLEPDDCAILEIAATLSADEAPTEVIGSISLVLFFAGDPNDCDPVVTEMHAKNGLWAECRASRLMCSAAQRKMLDWLPPVESLQEGEVLTLTGSTVHFDLAFLKRHMPELAARFHYRILDVSSVKRFCSDLGMPKLPKVEAHRALPDCLESLDHLERCRDWVSSLQRDVFDAREEVDSLKHTNLSLEGDVYRLSEELSELREREARTGQSDPESDGFPS
jgi:oligoribonuclease